MCFENLNFEGTNYVAVYEYKIHNYRKHFEKELNDVWKSGKGTCPINNCQYENKAKQKFVEHYFSKKHGILQKLIADELQRRAAVEKEETCKNSDQELAESQIIDNDILQNIEKSNDIWQNIEQSNPEVDVDTKKTSIIGNSNSENSMKDKNSKEMCKLFCP